MRDIYLPDQITKYKTFTYTHINTCRCAQKQEESMQMVFAHSDIADLHDSLRYRCSKETTVYETRDHLLIFIARLHTPTH